MSTAPVPTPGVEVAPLSEGARILSTFLAPSKTFSDLRRNASWWAPWLLIAIVSVVFVRVVQVKVGYRKVAENQIEMVPKAAAHMDRLPPDQREKQIEGRARGSLYFAYARPVLVLLWYAVIAAVLLGTFKFGASAEIPFKIAFAVVLYSSLPMILRNLLGIVSLLAGASPDSFYPDNPVATNIGYFLDPKSSFALYAFASSFDLFAIWTLVLTAIGFSSVAKLKRSTAFAGVFGWYIFVALLGTGVAALFS